MVELDRKARGERHPFVGHDLVNLGMLHVDAGNPAQAQQDFRGALEIYAESLPPDHPFVASALSGLGRSLLEQGRVKEAEQTLRQATQIAAKSLAADSPQLAAVNSSLGRALLAQSRPDEAAPLLRNSYPILAKAQGEDAVITRKRRKRSRACEAPGTVARVRYPKNIRYAELSVSSAYTYFSSRTCRSNSTLSVGGICTPTRTRP